MGGQDAQAHSSKEAGTKWEVMITLKQLKEAAAEHKRHYDELERIGINADKSRERMNIYNLSACEIPVLHEVSGSAIRAEVTVDEVTFYDYQYPKADINQMVAELNAKEAEKGK